MNRWLNNTGVGTWTITYVNLPELVQGTFNIFSSNLSFWVSIPVRITFRFRFFAIFLLSFTSCFFFCCFCNFFESERNKEAPWVIVFILFYIITCSGCNTAIVINQKLELAWVDFLDQNVLVTWVHSTRTKCTQCGVGAWDPYIQNRTNKIETQTVDFNL